MKLKKNRIKKYITAILMLSPTIVFFILFVYYPIVWGFRLSFGEFNLLSGTFKFVGLENFKRVIRDPVVLSSLKNTVTFSAFTVILGAITSLLLAVCIESIPRYGGTYKFIYFIPVVSPMVTVAMVWLWLYEPRIGYLNYLLSLFKIPPKQWLQDPSLALISIAVMSMWKGLGFHIVIFSAGIKGISKEFYEAAQIDGANNWQLFRYITLPLLSPVIAFVFITSAIGAFQAFTQMNVMTKGGPVGATKTIVYAIYEYGFQFYRMSYASAIAVLLFIIIMLLTLVQLKLFRE
jgi:ABC-type sugar transport system permease subunit